MLKLWLNLRCRMEMREAGYGFFEIQRAMSRYDDEKVSKAIELARGMGYSIPAELVNADSGEVGAGDGTILKKIIEFLQSDTGKMLIQILLSLLLAI